MKGFNLVSIPVRMRCLALWAGERGWAWRGRKNLRFDQGRALHHLLTEVFGPRVLCPFRLMVAPGRQSGNLYAYTDMGGSELREAAAHFAWPDHLTVLDTVRIAATSMPTQWREGQRLGFDLLARPVRRVSRPIRAYRGKHFADKPKGSPMEIDVFRLAKGSNPNTTFCRQDVYLGWLSERLDVAGELDRDATVLARYRWVRVARGKRLIEGPEAVFQGELTVRNPIAFSSLLRCGIGRHRAYAYGMLLLRPPNPMLR